MELKINHIIVKNYIWEGNHVFGSFERIESKDGEEIVYYRLDDGDIYSDKELIENDYEFIVVTSEAIINAFVHEKRAKERDERMKFK